MKVAGIITEYNPFHLGHAYQISTIKQHLDVDFIVVVMSGHYVQRGEPAIFDKWHRSKLALLGGVDLVIELPTPFACSSAELFAKGAIDLLHQLGIVDYLCFGSELGSLQPLEALATFLNQEPPNFKNALHSELKKGLSFPKARSNAISATFKDANALMKGSNNILAIEYIRALQSLHSPIRPYTIKREGAAYLSQTISETFPSATAIRKQILDIDQTSDLQKTLSKALPTAVSHILIQQLQQQTFTPISPEALFYSTQYLLETHTDATIQDIYDFPIELFHRLKRHYPAVKNYTALIDASLAKNYTKPMIQRSLLHMFLSIKSASIQQAIDSHSFNHYIRLLALKKSAAPLLKELKSKASLPIISNFKDDQVKLSKQAQDTLENENKYSHLYAQLVFQSYGIQKKDDYRQPMIILD